MGITQEEMADRLLMAGRTYIDLEQGKNCCSALTLALYMIYVSSDPVQFLEELKEAFELDSTQVAWFTDNPSRKTPIWPSGAVLCVSGLFYTPQIKQNFRDNEPKQ